MLLLSTEVIEFHHLPTNILLIWKMLVDLVRDFWKLINYLINRLDPGQHRLKLFKTKLLHPNNKITT